MRPVFGSSRAMVGPVHHLRIVHNSPVERFLLKPWTPEDLMELLWDSRLLSKLPVAKNGDKKCLKPRLILL